MRTERPLAPFFPCLLCLVAVFLGPVAAAGWSLAAFHPDPLSASRPKLLMWFATVAAQSLCWALLLAWMAPRLARLTRDAGSSATLWHAIAPTALLSVPWLVLAQGGSGAHSISGIEIRPGWMGAVGLIVAELGICGVFLEHRVTTLDGCKSPTDRVARLGQGLSRVHQFLFAAALVLGLGTIGAGALRGALEAEIPGVMPREYVEIYGVLGSLLLLAAYAPVRLDFYRRGERAIAEAGDSIPQDPAAIGKWAETRASLEAVLGNDPKSWFGLGGVVSSLLPLVMGSVGKLLDK
jgi:hypothetical protein